MPKCVKNGRFGGNKRFHSRQPHLTHRPFRSAVMQCTQCPKQAIGPRAEYFWHRLDAFMAHSNDAPLSALWRHGKMFRIICPLGSVDPVVRVFAGPQAKTRCRWNFPPPGNQTVACNGAHYPKEVANIPSKKAPFWVKSDHNKAFKY